MIELNYSINDIGMLTSYCIKGEGWDGIAVRVVVSIDFYPILSILRGNCISVDDDYIEGIDQLLVFDSFCHTIDIPMKGLNYIGITLIPPTSLDAFLIVIGKDTEYAELRNLLIDARNRNKYVIHYGL